MNRKNSVIIRFSALVLFVCIVFAFMVFGVRAYANANIDFKNDDMLFEAARSGNSTTFYYDASGEFTTDLDKYVPSLYSDAFYGGERKFWYSYK